LEDTLTTRLRGGSFTAISAGTRPTETVYRDRLITLSDNAILASRVGDHDDTALSSDVSDTLRPILFQLSESGDTGDDVVVTVSHKDSYLLGFTDSETWVLSGDPATGQLRRISDQVGIVDEDAWCVNHDIVYFLAEDGLYSVGADGSGLKAISEDKIPEDLASVTGTCTLTYNHSDRGVYIHKTGMDWFYDTERDQFWPFDTDTTDSHVLIGPLRIGGPNEYGLIQTLHGIIAEDSGTVYWRIVKGDTAEKACDNGKLAITAALAGTDYSRYVCAEGGWEEGRSCTEWPRTRAVWAVLWLSSSADWAYESIVMETVPFGRIRT
jgi:hypothetical protein